ncbi:MAG: DoxX family protein [Candidatus Dormibacteria bacterium]
MDLGILILRVVVGLALAAHGSQKLFGWFGGGGPKGTQGFIGVLGFRPVGFWTWAVTLGEFGGGLLTAFGLLNPIGPLAVIAAMTTATLVAHWPKGFWAAKGGYEFPLTNAAAAVAIAFAGPGRFSLDSELGIALSRGTAGIITLVFVLGVVTGLATRRTAPAPQPQPEP